MNQLVNAFAAGETPLSTTPVPTAAEAMIMLCNERLAPRRRDKLCTAVRQAVRLLAPGEDPKIAANTIRMSCANLNRIFTRPAAALGLSASRCRSFRSELRAVGRIIGQHEPDRRGRPILSPALQAKIEAMPPYRRHAIVDYLRFLEAAGTPLQRAGQEDFAAYLRQLTERTLCRNPTARARQVAAAWVWAREHIDGWPDVKLVPPGPKRSPLPPLSAYPVSLQEDYARHLTRLAGDDPDDVYPEDLLGEDRLGTIRRRCRLKPSTIRETGYLLRRALAALVELGNPVEELRTLGNLVEPPERIRSIVRFYKGRCRNGSSVGPWSIAEALRLLRRAYIPMSPQADKGLSEWVNGLKPRRTIGMTSKNSKRLRTLTQPRVRGMLLELPNELMRRAASKHLKPAKAAVLAMYATALEILLICPLRRGNLAGLRTDTHLHRPDPLKAKISHIFLPGDEVKGGQPIQWPVPAESAKLIASYIRHHRPHLAAEGNPYLFPGTGQRARTAQGLASQLSRTIEKIIGVEFNLHLVRHFAAWNFLQRNPGQYETVRRILGHKNVRITTAYYVGTEIDAEVGRFDANVLHERQLTRKAAIQAFKSGRGGLVARGASRGA